MAVTTSPRLLLTRWSAGTDPFTRAQLDQDFADLDNLAAIDIQGTLAARPAPGVRGRYYFATDDGPGRLYRDTGTAWTLINVASALGGAAPTASAVGDAGAEGASTAAARADHRHAREGFGNVTAATTYGIAAANGAAATVARSDHTHGSPALASSVPVGIVPDAVAAVGVATTPARADHVHAIVADTPGTSAVADTAAEGVSTAFARADHRHGRESLVALRDSLIPAGTVAQYAGAAAPAGWLFCDGAAVARATYPNLFAALGGTASPWGVPGGAGGSTFNVPDLRGRAPVGVGTGAGLTARALAAAGGAETVTLGIGQVPSHGHTANDHTHVVTGDGNHQHGATTDWEPDHRHPVGGSTGHVIGFRTDVAANGLVSGGLERLTFSDMQNAGGHDHGLATDWRSHSHGTGGASNRGTDAQGGGGAHENMPPFVAIGFIIKAH